MKHLNTIFIILLLFVIPVVPQNYDNDPLEDGYIIHNGGGQEIIGSTTSSVSLYKYYSEMEIAPWDTVIQILNYNHGYGQGFTDMITADFDGDSLNEIVKVWIENDVIQTEENRKNAIIKLSKRMAENIYDRLTDNF